MFPQGSRPKQAFRKAFKYQDSQSNEWVNISSDSELERAFKQKSTELLVIHALVYGMKVATVAAAPVRGAAMAASSGTIVSQDEGTPNKRKAEDTKPAAAKKDKMHNKKEDKIMVAMAEQKHIGIDKVDKDWLAVLMGLRSADNRLFRSALKALENKGWIRVERGTGKVSLTVEGLASDVAKSFSPPESNAEAKAAMHARIKAILKGKAPVMFDVLRDGLVHDKAEVMAKFNLTSEDNRILRYAIKDLKKYGLIVEPEKKKYQLTEKAFPYGK